MDKQCIVKKISDNLYQCEVCKFEHNFMFDRPCIVEIEQPTPYMCKHTGEVVEILDTKECNCSSRGTNISIHKCNLYNTDCGLLSLLRWRKRKELLDNNVKDCMQCPNRFDK